MKLTENNKTIAFDGIRRVQKKAKETISILRRDILSSGFKVGSVLVLTFVLSLAVSSVGGTVSYFSDVETTIGNYLRADPIGFQVVLDGGTQVDLSKGDVVLQPVMNPNPDSDPIQYFVTATVTGGDMNFCNSIHVLGTWPFPVDGSIVSIETATSTTYGSWTLTTSVREENKIANSSCSVDLVYFGWNADSLRGFGFSDTHKISLTFYIPGDYVSPSNSSGGATTPVINEVSSPTPLPEESTEGTTTENKVVESVVTPSEEKTTEEVTPPVTPPVEPEPSTPEVPVETPPPPVVETPAV